MKKRIHVILEVESNDELIMSDDFIRHDLTAEIRCAANDYSIIRIETETLNNDNI